jgi:hypothetical protein
MYILLIIHSNIYIYIYIIIFIFVIYAIFKEHESFGCPKYISIREHRDDNEGKVVRGTKSNPNDPTPVILDKIDYAADYDTRLVTWRSFLIAGTIGTIILWFIVFQKFPKELELVCGILVFFLMFYSLNSFYSFHIYQKIKYNIDNSTDILRDR